MERRLNADVLRELFSVGGRAPPPSADSTLSGTSTLAVSNRCNAFRLLRSEAAGGAGSAAGGARERDVAGLTWANLKYEDGVAAEAGGEWEGVPRQHVLLWSPGLGHLFDQVHCNGTGDMLLLVGARRLAVLRLPDRLVSRRRSEDAFHLAFIDDARYHTSDTKVLQAMWHPYSERHVVVLASGGGGEGAACRLLVYAVSELDEVAWEASAFGDGGVGGGAAGGEGNDAPYVVQGGVATWRCQNVTLPAAAEAPVMDMCLNRSDATAFSFGPDRGWHRFTVYLVVSDGGLFTLCPVVPPGMEVPVRVASELKMWAEEEREEAHGGLLMSVVSAAILKKCDYDDDGGSAGGGVGGGGGGGLTARRRIAAAVWDGLQDAGFGSLMDIANHHLHQQQQQQQQYHHQYDDDYEYSMKQHTLLGTLTGVVEAAMRSEPPPHARNTKAGGGGRQQEEDDEAVRIGREAKAVALELASMASEVDSEVDLAGGGGGVDEDERRVQVRRLLHMFVGNIQPYYGTFEDGVQGTE
jgi:hypothetical protein